MEKDDDDDDGNSKFKFLASRNVYDDLNSNIHVENSFLALLVVPRN